MNKIITSSKTFKENSVKPTRTNYVIKYWNLSNYLLFRNKTKCLKNLPHILN